MPCPKNVPKNVFKIPFRYSQRKRPLLNALTYSLSRCNGVNLTEEQLVTIKSGEWITKSTGFTPLTNTCKKRLKKKKKKKRNKIHMINRSLNYQQSPWCKKATVTDPKDTTLRAGERETERDPVTLQTRSEIRQRNKRWKQNKTPNPDNNRGSRKATR